MPTKSFIILVCIFVITGACWYLSQRSNINVKSFTYKQTPQGKLQLEIHYPQQWSPNHRLPVVVFFFGGAWISGGINHFNWQADYLARRGILAVKVDYRVDSRHGTLPNDAVADGRDAIRWLREHAETLGIDASRIVAAGGSAGGHIAAATTITDSQATKQQYAAAPNLLILINPVLDLEKPSSAMGFLDREQELIELMGEQTALSISPNHHINVNTPPTLLLMGGDDPLLEQAQDYVAKAQQVKVYTTLLIAKHQGHGFFNHSNWRSATMLEIDNFLKSFDYLQGEHQIIASNLQQAQMIPINSAGDRPRHPTRLPTP